MILSHQHFDLLNRVVLEHVIFHPPLKADASMHDEACLLYSVNGQSVLYGKAETNTLRPNEGVIMKCGTYINKWLPTNTDEPFEAVAVHFCPEVLKLVYQDKIPDFLNGSKKKSLNNITNIHTNQLISKYIQSLLFYFENPELINQELIILKVKEIILLLVNADVSQNIKQILQDLFNPEDTSFKKIIREHVFSDLSIEDLALLCNMSLSSFKRKFNSTFQQSPAKYIKEQRLEQSKELLQKTTKRIADVAFDCGFNDPGHFSKSFTSFYGISPSEFKRKLS